VLGGDSTDTRRRTGFDRSCMEDISPLRKSVSPPQQPLSRSRDRISDRDKKPSSVANGHHGEGTPRSSRWAPPEPSSILEAPELNETSSLQKLDKSEAAEKLEAVTPPRADDLDPPGKNDTCQLFQTMFSFSLPLSLPFLSLFGIHFSCSLLLFLYWSFHCLCSVEQANITAEAFCHLKIWRDNYSIG
jgi:hypothetical protein